MFTMYYLSYIWLIYSTYFCTNYIFFIGKLLQCYCYIKVESYLINNSYVNKRDLKKTLSNKNIFKLYNYITLHEIPEPQTCKIK